MAMTKWGRKETDHLAAAQPDLHLWSGIHGGRFDRTVSLLPVQLRNQLCCSVSIRRSTSGRVLRAALGVSRRDNYRMLMVGAREFHRDWRRTPT